MTDSEINARIALKLFPEATVKRNGHHVSVGRCVINFRKPGLVVRLLKTMGDLHISKNADLWVIHNQKPFTDDNYERVVALAYLGIHQ